MRYRVVRSGFLRLMERVKARRLAFGADLRHEAATNSTEGSFMANLLRLSLAILTFFVFLFLNDPANKLFLSAGLGADWILTPVLSLLF